MAWRSYCRWPATASSCFYHQDAGGVGCLACGGGREEPLLTQVEPVGEELRLTPEELDKLKAGLKVACTYRVSYGHVCAM